MTATNAQLEGKDVDEIVAYIEAGKAGYTGIRTGEPFTDADGVRWHQVFEYTNGRLTDAYVSRHGQQI